MAPARLYGLIQFVEGGVRLVGHLAHSFLLSQPLHHRPCHRLVHQRLGLFDLREFVHVWPADLAWNQTENNSSLRRESSVMQCQILLRREYPEVYMSSYGWPQ